jgi:hypothetical protein
MAGWPGKVMSHVRDSARSPNSERREGKGKCDRAIFSSLSQTSKAARPAAKLNIPAGKPIACWAEFSGTGSLEISVEVGWGAA